ncbi:MAG: EAL domain-containing protein [Gallionella sp.]
MIKKNPLPQTSLRQIFNRRLLLLLVLVCAISSTLITLAFERHSDSLNRNELQNQLDYVSTRIENQHRLVSENVDTLFNAMQWSGALQSPARLVEFINSQSSGQYGVLLNDTKSGVTLAQVWPEDQLVKLPNEYAHLGTLWMDEPHNTLYTHVTKPLQISGRVLVLHFFKPWRNKQLTNLTPPHANAYVMLGSQIVLSSSDSLALEQAPPKGAGYEEYKLDDALYLEDSHTLGDVLLHSGRNAALKLVIRSPYKNHYSLTGLILATLGATLLFAALLFGLFGRWLRQLGDRLDMLSLATVRFKSDSESVLRTETSRLLEQAHAGKGDQISQVALELSNLIDSMAQRADEQNSYLQTLDLLQDAVIEITAEGKLLRATDAFRMLTGGTVGGLCSVSNCVHKDDSEEVLEQISGLVYSQKQQVSIRFRIMRMDEPDAYLWVEGRFAPIIQNGVVVCIRGVLRDINNSYRQERQISHMALHDALTDLPNRVLLEDRIDLAITRANRNKQHVALAFIDLDHFKQINDNFGHKVGDQMLKEVTQRLLSALRSSDTLSRWGGDEFVVLCPDLNSLEDAREISNKLSLLTQKNISIDGTDFPFTFSAGFAVYPDDASNNEMLMAQADRAMFYAKAQGRNNIQFFNVIAAKEKGRKSFYIQSRLAHAIKKEDIDIWLQPLICAKSGKVLGAEVLARWHEDEQGWIPPSVFIPMAESLGLIEQLGQTVWQKSLHAIKQLPTHHRLSINLSKRQLFSNQIVQQFHDDAIAANIAPERIMLEITESIALSDVEYARERINELDANGFGIAVDDFGVGYSSLSQLHEIPAKELKLDISFIQRIHEKSGRSMVGAMISIAQSLGMQTVAEGVEDEETAILLTDMGVNILQGFHYAKAMPLKDYLYWLETRTVQ